jgi:hypothetical protein
MKLFPDLGNRERFSVNVYGPDSRVIIGHISNLFHPSTVDACFDHDAKVSAAALRVRKESGSIRAFASDNTCR